MVRKVLVGFVFVVMAIQVVPYGCEHDNPPVRTTPEWPDDEAETLARRACYDCHSHETVWPWYANIAPVRWIVFHHVEDGRAFLNFSDWDTPQEHAHEAAHEVEEGEMPLSGYLPLHPEADLSAAETAQLIEALKVVTASHPQKREGS